MAAFGSSVSGVTVQHQNQAFDVVIQSAIDQGFTPDEKLGEDGILAAIIGSYLKDDVAAPAVTVGSGTQITKFAVYSASLTPAAVVNVSGISEVTHAFTGVVTGDKIYVNPPAVSNNVVALSWRVTTADVVAAAWFAFASVSSTPAAGTYKIVAVKS